MATRSSRLVSERRVQPGIAHVRPTLSRRWVVAKGLRRGNRRNDERATVMTWSFPHFVSGVHHRRGIYRIRRNCVTDGIAADTALRCSAPGLAGPRRPIVRS